MIRAEGGVIPRLLFDPNQRGHPLACPRSTAKTRPCCKIASYRYHPLPLRLSHPLCHSLWHRRQIHSAPVTHLDQGRNPSRHSSPWYLVPHTIFGAKPCPIEVSSQNRWFSPGCPDPIQLNQKGQINLISPAGRVGTTYQNSCALLYADI